MWSHSEIPGGHRCGEILLSPLTADVLPHPKNRQEEDPSAFFQQTSFKMPTAHMVPV